MAHITGSEQYTVVNVHNCVELKVTVRVKLKLIR